MDSRGTSRKKIHGSHNDRKTQRRTNNPMCNRRPSLSTLTLVPVIPRYSNRGGLPDCGGVPEPGGGGGGGGGTAIYGLYGYVPL